MQCNATGLTHHLIVSSDWPALIPLYLSRRYPKDSDKIMLAKQTGLTRSQVSNWFINARVRLWKPMVEEMYLEETKYQDGGGGGNDEGKSGGGAKSADTNNGVDSVTPRADVAVAATAMAAAASFPSPSPAPPPPSNGGGPRLLLLPAR